MVAEVAQALSAAEQPLEVVRSAFEVDRVSLARIDLRARRFEIAADAGAELLAPGTALPLSTCSYFAQVAEGQAFHDGDFDASRTFDRPVDGVILATGFHSGCSVPLREDGRVVGAISLSATRRGVAMADFVSELEPLADVLVSQLDRLRVDAAVRALRTASAETPRDGVVLTARERELLNGLEEGLRFKQVARRLGISEATAKTHARNLFRKLDATSRAEAVHAAREHGLFGPHPNVRW
jgi:DNA-binding CsgD family transcriptional regulator